MKCPSCGTEGMPNRKFCGVCGHAFPAQTSTEYSTPPSSSGGYSTPPSGAGGYATPPSGAGGYSTPPSGAGGYSQPTVGGYTPPSSPYAGGGGMGASYGYSGGPQVAQRYKALRVMAVLYKVLAFILAGISAILGLITLTSPRTFGLAYYGGVNVLAGLFWFISGALVFVFLYGAGEFIVLFINIEENTRTTNEILQRRNGSSSG